MQTSSQPHVASLVPSGFAEQLRAVLPQLLAPGAMPDDWDVFATTYDLQRFHSEADFIERFGAVIAELAAAARAPTEVKTMLASCALPSDYARLGQPLSTVLELLVQSQSGARRALTFASRTKPYLSIVEAYSATRTVRLFTPGVLSLSDAKKSALREASVELHEHHRGPVPAAVGSALTVFVHDAVSSTYARGEVTADATVFPLEGGGVVLLENDAIAVGALQLVRKRTAAALLAVDARAELSRAAGLPVTAPASATNEQCEALLKEIFPEVRTSATFCTGLAAEAAVFSATARLLDAKRPVKLMYAENGYGGTCQLIAELLARDGVIDPVPLPVLARDASGKTITLVEQMVSALERANGAPAFFFLETPTNPELQVHDFPRLFDALRSYEKAHGVKVPVLADTTLAPLFPLLSQPYARDWPCVIVKSGSKYFTRGKATLGVAFAGQNETARAIVDGARAYGRDADTAAKPSQLAALADGLGDLRPRMERIAVNTTHLTEGLRAALGRYGKELLLYTIDEAHLAQGLASGVLSFYLPAAPSTHSDLVDEFVAELLTSAPKLVKSRVSYGQSTGGGEPDFFYVINPQESTQGALSAQIKAAQKRDNVQICRISVPEHADVPGLLKAIDGFLARKYG